MTRAVAMILLVCVTAAAGDETTQPPEFARLRVGFSDRYQVGVWTPVVLTLRGGGEAISGAVTLTVSDDDGLPSRVSTPANEPVRVEPGRETTVRMCVRFGRIEDTLSAEFCAGDRTLAKKTYTTANVADADHFLPALDSNRQLLLTIGLDAAETAAAMGRGVPSDLRPVVAEVQTVADLPKVWYEYEGVDSLILCTSRPEILRDLRPGSPQFDALDQWLRLGGKMLISLGAQASQALQESPALADLIPGRFSRTISLHQAGALETYVPDAKPIETEDSSELRVARLTAVIGSVEAHEADVPLVIRAGRGFGQVVCLAVDLEGPPLQTWPSRGLLLRRLLGLTTTVSEDSPGGQAVMGYGFVDVAGQLRKSLDHFDGVEMASFWLIAMLILAYIALVGPVDYFFLRKVVRRMGWTWLTFPAIVAAASVGAYYLAHGFKGDQLHINQVDLIDVDTATGLTRGTTWANVFVPESDCYDFSARPIPLQSDRGKGDEPNGRCLLSWMGLSGGGLGGMAPQAISPALGTEPYDFSPQLDALRGCPIPVWSTKALTVRWTATGRSPVQAKLTDEGWYLSGSITSKLPFALSDCMLAYGHWAVELGTLHAGEPLLLDDSVRQPDLKAFLNRPPREDNREKGANDHANLPYDRSCTDVAHVLRTMMFFEATGGAVYTGLANGYQRFVDCSGILDTQRAVLVGYGPAGETAAGRPGVEFHVGGRAVNGPEHKTVFRFVFPVNKAAAERSHSR